MPENTEKGRLLRLLWAVLWGAGIWIGACVVLPWLMPFLLALGLASLLEPAVAGLIRLKLPRWAAAALCTAALTLLSVALLALGLRRAWAEAAALLDRLPVLLNRAERWIYRLQVAAPPALRQALADAIHAFSQGELNLSARIADWAGRGLAGTIAALPQAALFTVTTALATYFTSAGRPAVLAFLSRQLPGPWQARGPAVLAQLRQALSGWFRTQGLLMLVTFGELLLALVLLGTSAPLLSAALIALVDALPVLGAGVVLLPWAVGALLGGRTGTALGLLALYAIVCLVRSLLEPKLLGERMGLHPLAALGAMYVGFQALGLLGMLLGPLALVVLQQLRACGVVRLWRD